MSQLIHSIGVITYEIFVGFVLLCIGVVFGSAVVFAIIVLVASIVGMR